MLSFNLFCYLDKLVYMLTRTSLRIRYHFGDHRMRMEFCPGSNHPTGHPTASYQVNRISDTYSLARHVQLILCSNMSKQISRTLVENDPTTFLLFGGKNTSLTFDELWSLNVVTAQWKQLPSSGKERHSMACAVSGDTLVVWGGKKKFENIFALNALTSLLSQL